MAAAETNAVNRSADRLAMATKPHGRAVPKWRPAPASLIQQFGRAIEGFPEVETRNAKVNPKR